MTTCSRSTSPAPLRILLLLFFTLFHLNLSCATPISLQLHHISPSSTLTTPATASDSSSSSSGSDPYKALAALATASLLRAHHLKNRTKSQPSQFKTPEAASSSARSRAPLSPHAYGGYTVTLALGTPPQVVPLVFDTGSDLSWVPCTSSYECSGCSSSGGASGVRAFLPKASSTAKLVGCRNPKCGWIHSPQTILKRCPPACSSTKAAANCSAKPQICPPYLIIYGSGSTGGVLFSETLHLPTVNPSSSSSSSSGGDPLFKPKPDFAVGCSVFSSHQPPAGIAGFGRGPASFGWQLHLSTFSYCLIPRRFDDVPGKAGSLVLNGNPDDENENDPIKAGGDHSGQHLPRQWSSTPFLHNLAAAAADSDSPDQRNPFGIYYYVGLRRVTVGGNKVKIPQELLVPGTKGDGGAIIDSSSTFTYLDPRIMRLVVQAFEAAVAGSYNRSRDAETRTGLRLCFNVSGTSSDRSLQLPALDLHFKGGARMELPLENYFAIVAGDDGAGHDPAPASAVCLMAVSDGDDDDDNAGDGGGRRNEPRPGSGPSIILGAFQQQNYRMVFDLKKSRLRFRPQRCLAAA